MINTLAPIVNPNKDRSSSFRSVHWLGASIVSLYFLLPYLILGKDGYILFHDNFDVLLIYFDVLKQNELLLAIDGDTPIPNFLYGLETKWLVLGFSLIRVIFFLLPSFWAYVFNTVIVHLVGYFGVLFLIREYFKATYQNNNYSVWIAILFATLPIYSLHGIGIMGQPFLIWSFFNLLNKKNILASCIIISIFPFYSSFSLVGLFILASIGLYGLYNFFETKSLNLYFWLGLVWMSILSIVSNYSLFMTFFVQQELSHRLDYTHQLPSFTGSIFIFLKIFFTGHHHSTSIIILPTYAIFFLALIREIPSKIKRSLQFILGLLLLISLLNALDIFLRYYFPNTIITAFSFSRFFTIIPMLWILGLIVVLGMNVLKDKIVKLLLGLQLLFCFLLPGKNVESLINYNLLLFPNFSIAEYVNDHLHPNQSFLSRIKLYVLDTYDTSSYNKLVSEELFDEIEIHINKPKKDYKVINLGIPSCIAQYNEFNTLDGLFYNYPLDYKRQFRAIVANELEKDQGLKDYFDGWGSNLTLFSSEIYHETKWPFLLKNVKEIKQLSIDTPKIRELGGRYIFSAFPIKNASDIGLKYHKKFSNKNSNWVIYLYEVKSMSKNLFK